uniref:Uncharacterized protein n=1 Tax=Cacopsylla melanoneura TaxID=428564 RepID=A0A8D8X6F5_9HEMI
MASKKTMKKYFVGDSQTARLLSVEEFGVNIVGWSYPGKTVQEIFNGVYERVVKGGEKTEKENSVGIMWVGTNNFLKDKGEPREEFKRFLKFLRKLFRYILLVQLPPVPKLGSVNWKIKEFNQIVRSYAKDDETSIINCHDLFIVNGEIVRGDFHEVMGHNVHMNQSGLAKVAGLLRSKLMNLGIDSQTLHDFSPDTQLLTA